MTDEQVERVNVWPLIHTLLVQFAPRIAEAEAATTYDARIAIINGVSAHIAGKVDEHIAALPPQDAAAVRAAALEEAAQLSETWFNRHRPKQPDKSRFNIYDIEHWAKSATRLVAEDIRALASAPPAAEIERTKGET